MSDATGTDAGYEYTGHLDRGEHEGEIVGWLIDRLGYRLEIRGAKDPRRGGGYILTGRVVHIPAYLRQPAIDGEGAG